MLIVTLGAAFSVLFFLINVVVEQLDDKVDVRQYHSPAAVAFAPELVEGVTKDRVSSKLNISNY
mgnify:CR=1 FL=1